MKLSKSIRSTSRLSDFVYHLRGVAVELIHDDLISVCASNSGLVWTAVSAEALSRVCDLNVPWWASAATAKLLHPLTLGQLVHKNAIMAAW